MTDTHCTPLPRPPTTEKRACDHELARDGHAEVGDADRESGQKYECADGAPASTRRKSRLPSTMPAPQRREQHAVAELVGLQRLLRVDDLDRDDQGEEDDRQRLAADQEAARCDSCARSAGPAVTRFTNDSRSALVSREVRGSVASEDGDDGEASPRRRSARSRRRTCSTSSPPSAAPPTLAAAKPMLSSALPARSRPVGLQHGVHRAARDASRGEHQGAVEEREQQHRDEREGLREQRERREDERLAQRRARGGPAGAGAGRRGP